MTSLWLGLEPVTVKSTVVLVRMSLELEWGEVQAKGEEVFCPP